MFETERHTSERLEEVAPLLAQAVRRSTVAALANDAASEQPAATLPGRVSATELRRSCQQRTIGADTPPAYRVTVRAPPVGPGADVSARYAATFDSPEST